MSSMNSALFAYPKQAEFGRAVPKNKIYEHSGANTRLKGLFVEQVEKIVWRYKLAPETINLAARPEVPEIQVFAIQMKTPELHRDVLRCIDGAIPFPIVFELTQGQVDEARTQVVAAYKRSSDTLSASLVCSEYFESGWMPASAEREQLPFALDLAGLYEQLLYRLVPIGPRTQEPLRDLIARAEAARSKAIEIAKAKSRLAKEKQFNRKVDINTKLRQLKTELDQMNR